MAFTTAEKVDIRRHCGYPMYGGTPSSFQSYRFFTAYGTLEYRMNNMLAEEEAVVWTHNKNEVRDRATLFNKWRRDLCSFIGVPPGPGLGGGEGSVQLVV